jgi:hypothetical protein
LLQILDRDTFTGSLLILITWDPVWSGLLIFVFTAAPIISIVWTPFIFLTHFLFLVYLDFLCSIFNFQVCRSRCLTFHYFFLCFSCFTFRAKSYHFRRYLRSQESSWFWWWRRSISFSTFPKKTNTIADFLLLLIISWQPLIQVDKNSDALKMLSSNGSFWNTESLFSVFLSECFSQWRPDDFIHVMHAGRCSRLCK